MQRDSTIAEAALMYAGLGWHVFPCRPGQKIPLTRSGCREATIDARTIKAWWERWPDANIGLLCGPASGVYVVDIDVDGEKGVDGWKSLDLILDGENMPATVRQDSPRGGAHFLFMADTPTTNKNNFRNGIDIRADGYYIMLAPSIHPNGKVYQWATGAAPGEIPLAKFPDCFRPELEKRPAPALPWLQQASDSTPAPAEETPDLTAHATKPITAEAHAPVEVDNIVERARLYLAECAPAIQGHGGHDALLWAARAMVVGFKLSDSDALSLLWAEFNPRCVPPWDPGNPADRKDFDRKVTQARNTPFDKPAGWLLDEYGLRDGDAALRALGMSLADGLMSGPTMPATATSDAIESPVGEWVPFPVDCFPPKIADYVRLVSEAHCVDPSFVALPVLVVAGAAMGNAFRLRLKSRYIVPPTLWGAIVARSGVNKTGPMKDVVEPLRSVPRTEADETLLRNPQHRMIVGDATTEAVIHRLTLSPRGLLGFLDELAGWFKGFGAYKSGGGADEQFWLKAWDADRYMKDRKTDSEETDIPAAAVSVLGGIQPAVMAEVCNPSRFANGLLPRLLVVNPPSRNMMWTENEITPDAQTAWCATVNRLRTFPFAATETETAGQYSANVIELSPRAKGVYVAAFDSLSLRANDTDERSAAFISKARGGMIPRLALVLHGLTQSSFRCDDLTAPVTEETMVAAVKLGEWFLAEALRMYGVSAANFAEKRDGENVAWIRGREGHRCRVRDLHRAHTRRYSSAEEAKADLERLVARGLGKWEGTVFVLA